MSISDAVFRNPATVGGAVVLSGAATFGTLVAVSVAPRTTLGLAALGSGLMAAGHHDRLARWRHECFGTTEPEAE